MNRLFLHGKFHHGSCGIDVLPSDGTGGTAESSTEGSSGGGFADSVENFDAAMRGKEVGC